MSGEAMKRVEILERRRLLDHKIFKVDAARLSFERYDGTMSEPVERLVFERGDSVAALVRLRDDDRLLFTEQFRFPTVEKGPGWVTEVFAGSIEPGEAPDATLRRELEEELGYRAEHVEPIATFYVSPGGSSERIWLYYVETSGAARVSAGGGLASEHEDIRVVSFSMEEARAALDQQRFADAKTIVALQWLFSRRDR
jgi:nudix-type nucleoside diphosphatase (YffH/AdpP family)